MAFAYRFSVFAKRKYQGLENIDCTTIIVPQERERHDGQQPGAVRPERHVGSLVLTRFADSLQICLKV